MPKFVVELNALQEVYQTATVEAETPEQALQQFIQTQNEREWTTFDNKATRGTVEGWVWHEGEEDGDVVSTYLAAARVAPTRKLRPYTELK